MLAAEAVQKAAAGQRVRCQVRQVFSLQLPVPIPETCALPSGSSEEDVLLSLAVLLL